MRENFFSGSFDTSLLLILNLFYFVCGSFCKEHFRVCEHTPSCFLLKSFHARPNKRGRALLCGVICIVFIGEKKKASNACVLCAVISRDQKAFFCGGLRSSNSVTESLWISLPLFWVFSKVTTPQKLLAKQNFFGKIKRKCRVEQNKSLSFPLWSLINSQESEARRGKKGQK